MITIQSKVILYSSVGGNVPIIKIIMILEGNEHFSDNEPYSDKFYRSPDGKQQEVVLDTIDARNFMLNIHQTRKNRKYNRDLKRKLSDALLLVITDKFDGKEKEIV